MQSELNINDKKAIIYLFDVLSANMLSDVEREKYGEEMYMLLNPMDRFLLNKCRKEGKCDVARNLLKRGFSIEEVVQITGLSENDIINMR